MSIAIIVPSRGRPQRCTAMLESALGKAEHPGNVRLVVVLDEDDPRLPDYLRPRLPAKVITMPRRGYTAALNLAARELWDEYTILGAFGDDVLFRTPGWDERVEESLARPGIAYGNDLVHAKGHPTAIWMSSVIAKALDYLAIPQSRHLWVDDAWKDLGQRTGTLRYLPDVIVEHMHPAVGKAPEDQTYREVYDGELGHADHLGFLAWQRDRAETDAALVRAAIGA